MLDSNEIKTLRQRVKDLSSLIEVSIIINAATDLDELIQLVLEKAQSVMNAEASSVFLVNDKRNLLECEVALGEVGDKVTKTIRLQKGQGVAGWVWEHDQPLIVPDVEKDKRFYSLSDKSSGFTTKTILAVPLKTRDHILGVAEVINRMDGKEFTIDDLDLFSTFCRQVTLAIENITMHRNELEQERMRQQLESANEIQQSFMPQDLPGGKDEPFELAAINLPASAVGGDFYDAIDLEDDKLAVLIGDVSGKGVPAALYMARLMSDFRFFVQQTPQPALLLESLNEVLVERSRRGMFVTLLYMVIEKKSGKCTFCNAGHLPLMYRDISGKVREFPCESGFPLGIAPNIEFDEQSLTLSKNEMLLYITDGVIEAKNSIRQEFSMNRVVNLLSQSDSFPGNLVAEIRQDISEFAQNTPQHDDITLMALKWTG